ncbi:hypothetical protein [Microbacterium gubbeenense]|uniref:hypothetical protein n=1 Tax=Microbacterium gubbeenense TaxID=159896 RepID=UPI00040CE4FF|nr:hypothetical protein [Microbacterium gubbeenense]
MSTLSRKALAQIRGRVTAYVRQDTERGSITLEQVAWAAGIGIVAIGVIAGVVAAINAFASQIPTGL